MATVSVSREGTGTLSITATIADNSITIDDNAAIVDVKLKDTTDGTFAVENSGNAVDLDNSVWIRVYERGSSGQNTGSKTIYFASNSGTQNLQYKVTAR